MIGDRSHFSLAAVDALEEQIAVIDQQGLICFVNRTWRSFWQRQTPAEALPEWPGLSVYKVGVIAELGDDAHSEAVREGVRTVLHGEEDFFEAEFPWHAERERHWFSVRIVALVESGLRDPHFLLSYREVTHRYLANEQSAVDALTGLANARRLSEFLYFEWQRCIRSGHWISLLEIDIDHFSVFNHKQGPLEGDHALCEISQVLRRSARRPSDLLIRWGGDRFILVLGDTTQSQAMQVAEALRLSIRKLQLDYGETGQLTISVGVASHQPVKGEIETLLIERAEKALLVAKQGGRDRIDFYRPGVVTRIGEDAV